MSTAIHKKDKYEVDLTSGSLFKNILFFALPLLFSNLLQSLYTAADLVVVGHFAGALPLAAVGATGTVIGLVTNLFIALSLGTSVTVAVAIGARGRERVQRLVHTSMALAFLFGAVITVFGLVFTDWMLAVMDTPADIFAQAALYMRIYFAGSIFSMVYNFGASVLRAAGDSRRPMYYLMLSGLLNVLLNLLFVVGFGMAAEGVALATVISQALSAVLVLITMLRTEGDCHFSFRQMRLFRDEALDILKIGVPAAIQSAVFNISNSIVQKSVNSFDTLAISGNTAASNLDNFAYTAMFAMNTTAVSVVGQHVGAGQHRKLGKIIAVCGLLTTLIWFVVSGLILLFAEPLLSIYLPDTPEAISFGMEHLVITMSTYVLCGLMDTFVGCSRGMGNTFAPMVVAILGVVGVRIVFIYTVFAAYHTMTVLFLAYTVSWFVTAVGQFILCMAIRRRICRRHAALEKEKEEVPV